MQNSFSMLKRLPAGVLCIYALKVVSPNTRLWADEAVSASTLADLTELSLEGGMGLAYVKTLVNRHGGCIWCESEAGIGGSSVSLFHRIRCAKEGPHE